MGPGGAKYLTLQAVEAVKAVDVFLILEKQGVGKEALGEARRRILDVCRGPGGYRVVTAHSPPRAPAGEDYNDVVADWHARKTEGLAAFIAEHVAQGETAGLLVWGDPALYDSTVTIVRELRDKRGLDIALKVIPGVTSLQVLAARHATPLHEIGGEFLVTTARRLGAAAAERRESIAVMLDSNAAFTQIDASGYDIYWCCLSRNGARTPDVGPARRDRT